MGHRILIIDNEKHILNYVHETLLCEDYTVKAFDNPLSALAEIDTFHPELVISDVRMDEMTGDEVLRRIKERPEPIGVILMTGISDLDHAINAFRNGAFDYITKPFRNTELLSRVRRYFNREGLTAASQAPVAHPRVPRRSNNGSRKFIGSNKQIRNLMGIVQQIAPTNAPIFIQAESGTGKEVFSRLIHDSSNRANKPFLAINCATLPKELVESTLFGHVKGAFTGAIDNKDGSFIRAEGGTLLLDEITEIDPGVQAKLLRVLQEKEVQRVGDDKVHKVDVRIIATSNRNVKQAIHDGLFRQDLYFRLNVIPIHIPSLRDRRDDIPELANYFCATYTAEFGFREKTISERLHAHLLTQPWEGNVRELENYIQRGVIMAQDSHVLDIEHTENLLFAEAKSEFTEVIAVDIPLMPMHEVEMYMIKKALEHTQGHQKEAAKLMQISDRTIRNKIGRSPGNGPG